MELIYTNLKNIYIPENIVACLGIFDGIHSGHSDVINKVKEIGSLRKMKTALITFDPHPDYVLGKTNKELYITPLNDKIDILKKEYNLDYFIVIEFTKEISKLTYEGFYNLFLKSIKCIIVGEGFRFGYKNQGTIEEIKKLHLNKNGNDVIAVAHKCFKNLQSKISTQDIVLMLQEGKVLDINNLGVVYKVKGTIVKGAQIGNKLGYPTANVSVTDKYYPIKNGVYAVVIVIDGIRRLGIANYGYNPSFNTVEKPRLEVHIFEFHEDIYDKKVEVEFIEFIREEITFASINEFIEQLKLDCNKCISKYGGKYETINCRSNG